MKIIKMFRFSLLFLLIAMFFLSGQFSVATENNNYINEGRIIHDGNILIIKLDEDPPDTYNKQRENAFTLLFPYLSKNTEKASVIWQKNVYSLGKEASIANVYIKPYLDRKINLKKFVGYFNLQTIDPIHKRKNDIKKMEINPVSDELSRKALILSEKADMYRITGKYDSAIRIYNQALEYNPHETTALFWLAEIYYLNGDKELAENYYVKVLSIDPDFNAADDALYKIRNNH